VWLWRSVEGTAIHWSGQRDADVFCEDVEVLVSQGSSKIPVILFHLEFHISQSLSVASSLIHLSPTPHFHPSRFLPLSCRTRGFHNTTRAATRAFLSSTPFKSHTPPHLPQPKWRTRSSDGPLSRTWAALGVVTRRVSQYRSIRARSHSQGTRTRIFLMCMCIMAAC
jgi:hypothetical protein